MFKKTLIGLAVTGTIAAVAYINFIGSEVALMDIHPDIPQDVIVKAHRAMLRDILKLKLSMDTNASDDEIDAIFMTKYVNPLL